MWTQFDNESIPNKLRKSKDPICVVLRRIRDGQFGNCCFMLDWHAGP